MADISIEVTDVVKRKEPLNWLNISVKTWFVVTAIGQWLFVAYITGYYGLRFVNQGVDGFDGTHLASGFIPGDDTGNTALAIHVLVAALIIAAGQIQLVPNIRNKIPRIHRISGWFYMVASVAVSIAGMYLVWSRERVIGSFTQDIGTTLGGVLVMVFVPIALYHAINRNIASHRRWALRLFMVVSAVWFLRLMIYGWFIATGGIGIDMKTFSGPYLNIVHFAQYLLPLLLLELYFYAQQTSRKVVYRTVTGLIFMVSAIMAIGIFAISSFSWIPSIGA